MVNADTGMSHVCEICKEPFSRKAKLSNHLRCHVIEPKEEDIDETLDAVVDSGLKAVKNETSFEVFARNRSDVQKCRCSFCEKTFARSDLLCHHMVLSHPEEALKCKICSKVFVTQANYNIHKSEHLARINGEKALERPYTGSVSQYIKVEGKEEVSSLHFKCHLCTRSFSCYTNLWSHAWVHTDEKPYVCSVCGRGFGRLYRLRYHMAFHTNSKPYECEECGKGFKLDVFLKTHQKAVHGVAATRRSERWSRSFVLHSKSISEVKSSDFEGKSKNCKIKKMTLISKIFKPMATRMVIEAKQVCEVSKKNPKKLDHLKTLKNQRCALPKSVVTVSRSVKAIASRHISKKASLSMTSNSGVIERGIKVRNKGFKSHCVDNNFACTEDFELDSEAVDLKNFVATKTGEIASKTLFGIEKVKRLHFRVAEENIKLIINNESSVEESEKVRGEKNASQRRRISEKSDFTKGTLVKDSKMPMHIRMQPNKENLRGKCMATKQSIVGKNMQTDYGHREMKNQVPKNKKDSCRPSKFEALFVCKVCKKSYRHKTSLNRHFKKSSHAQSNNLKILFPKGDLPKLNLPDSRDIGNLKKKRDEKVLQDLLPKVRNNGTKTIVDMNSKIVHKHHEQREVLDYGSSSGVVLQTPDDEGKPLNLSLKRPDIFRKSLPGKTKQHVKAGNGGQKIGNKKVSFHPDLLQNKKHQENNETVSSNQIGKSSRFSVGHARTYNQRVMEAHYSSKPNESESVSRSNLKIHVDDTGKDASLNMKGKQTSVDISKATSSKFVSEGLSSYSEEIQRARSKTLSCASEAFKGIDLTKNMNDKVANSCFQECDNSKLGRPDYAMQVPVHSKVQTSSQNETAKHSVQELHSTEFQCQRCLRKFKRAYSLKRHCMKQVCTGGRKRFDSEGGNFKYSSKKRLPLPPQELLKGDQALITQGQQILKADRVLKPKSYKHEISSMGNEASSEMEQLKKIHSRLLMESCKNSLPRQYNNIKLGAKEVAVRQNTEGQNPPSVKNLPAKPYKCYRCDKRYATFYFFEKHVNRNSCSSYKCLFCQKRFKDRSIWEHHMEVEKAVIQNKSLSCAGCKTVFCRPSDLARHMMRNTCPRCSVECFCSYFLDLHEESGKCNTGLPGDAGGKCGCPSGSGGCQICYSRNDDPKEETTFHLDYPYGNLIIDDASESSDTFNREANIALRKPVPSMFQYGFTSNCENSVTEGEREDSTRNNNESQNGIRDDYSCSNGKFIVNYTGAGGGADAFQGDNSRNGLMYGYGYFEPSAVTLQDNTHTAGASDIDCLMPQLTNQHSLSYYSQLLNYHCHNYSSQLQGQSTEKAKHFVDKGGKQTNGDGKLLFSPEYFGTNVVSQEAIKHFHNSEQQNSSMATNAFENAPNASSQFRVLESIDWEGHCSTENPYCLPVPVHNAVVYDIEGYRVDGDGGTPNYESFGPVNVSLADNSSNANPNLCENHHYPSHSTSLLSQ